MSAQRADLTKLFRFLNDESLNLQDLVERYVNYHGLLYHGHQMLLIRRLRAAAAVLDAPATAQYADRDIVWPDGRIAPEFLTCFTPGFAGAWYDAASATDLARTLILAACVNEWRSTTLPAPFNIRLGQAERPAIEILFGKASHLFVSPYGYQRYDPGSGRSWPAASSRAFPRSIEGHRTVAIDTP
ncbi:MAG: hypothetical protein ABI369_15680, partial [Acetobacteraceae bacterium]